MKRLLFALIIFVIALGYTPPTFSAETTPTIAELQTQIQRLRAENETLKKENQALRKQLLEQQTPAQTAVQPMATEGSSVNKSTKGTTEGKYWMTISSSKRHNSSC